MNLVSDEESEFLGHICDEIRYVAAARWFGGRLYRSVRAALRCTRKARALRVLTRYHE